MIKDKEIKHINFAQENLKGQKANATIMVKRSDNKMIFDPKKLNIPGHIKNKLEKHKSAGNQSMGAIR